MEEGKIYINSNDPVYISYAWDDDNFKGLENDVNDFCKSLKANAVFFKRDKEGEDDEDTRLTKYCRSIKEAAEEIGDGKIVIVFVSDKYFQSLDCLYEWRCISKKEKTIGKGLYFFVLDNCSVFTTKNCYKDFYDILNTKRDEILDRLKKNGPLSDIELIAIRNNMFQDDLKHLLEIIMNHCQSKSSQLRQGGYKILIDKLKNNIQISGKSICLKPPILKPTSPYRVYVEGIEKEKSILLVGDYILGNGNETLGDTFESALLEIANRGKSNKDVYDMLYKWYKDNYTDSNTINNFKQEGFSAIKDLDSATTVDCTLFINLLATNKFDIILSIGYSEHIRKVVRAFALAYGYEIEDKELCGRSFQKDKTEHDKQLEEDKNNPYIELFPKNELVNKKVVKFYNIVRTTERTTEVGLLFSEMDIVKCVHSCIAATTNKRENINRNYLLVLGTNFPSWALRFMWYSLTTGNTKKTALYNITPTDSKTSNFLTNNNVIFVKKEDTKSFIDEII